MQNKAIGFNKNINYMVWGRLNGPSFELDKAIGDDNWFVNHSQAQWFNVPLNSDGFRSDEFSNSHDGLHIIFSGDSNTFGMGLEKEEIWSYLTYQEISKNVKTSGYFNLGSPGSSIMTCILNIFKYFKKYGNPDMVFINLTEPARFYDYVKEINSYATVFYQDNERKPIMNQIKKIIFDHYLMLEQYCSSNNIQLYSFTWDTDQYRFDPTNPPINDNSFLCTNDILQPFDTFYKLDSSDKMWNDLYSICSEEVLQSDYFQYARDGSHYGIGPNIWWANKMIKAYNTRNNM